MNDAPSPHDPEVNPIVAARHDDVRRELAELTKRAAFGVGRVTQDPTALEGLLRSGGGAWVVTGGAMVHVRPFLSSARKANAAVVAVLSGGTDADDRADFGYGGLALLRSIPRIEAFQAAVLASKAGLSVWDPDLNLAAEAAESGATPLSPRERTVLELTGAGLSTKAVARQLGISPNTVKFHLQSTFEKLGVASRAEAVMAGIRRGELAV